MPNNLDMDIISMPKLHFIAKSLLNNSDIVSIRLYYTKGSSNYTIYGTGDYFSCSIYININLSLEKYAKLIENIYDKLIESN